MKGGKLTCRRKENYKNENGFNCIKMSCVDYKRNIYNEKDICDDHEEYWDEDEDKNAKAKNFLSKKHLDEDAKYKYFYWKEYWDEEAQASYWYNHLTEEATWINPKLNHIEKKTSKNTIENAGKVFVPRRQHRLYFQKTRKNKKKQEKTRKNKKKQEHR